MTVSFRPAVDRAQPPNGCQNPNAIMPATPPVSRLGASAPSSL